jgi:hypothetical protein
MLNGNAIESRIANNTFECSLRQGTTRYSNFIYATTGTYTGKLFINDNIQTSGDLRQFYLHDAGTLTDFELYVANNTFNDFNGGIGIFGVAVYNGYKKIGIYNNTQGDDSAGNYKGLFFVDGTGTINENVIVEYGDNILETTALRTGYLSYLEDGSSEVAIKNTITFVDLKEKVSLENALSDFGLLVQELKGRKTYITDSEGNLLAGAGTEENPYVLPEISESGLPTGGTDGQVLTVQTDGSYAWEALPTTTIPLHQRDVLIATANQTAFTLTEEPIGDTEKVIVSRNGITISDAFTWVGTTGTYDPALNYGCVLDENDKLIFSYESL